MGNSELPVILVVDDEPIICDLLTLFLRPEGYEVLTAGSVEQALNHIDSRQIDLILLDLRMPGDRDCEDLLFLLRDRGSEVPIIIVSGWVDDEAVAAHPDCVHGVLRKPVTRDALLAMVQQAMA
jgi:DNA-binding NtrC family response regulator